MSQTTCATCHQPATDSPCTTCRSGARPRLAPEVRARNKQTASALMIVGSLITIGGHVPMFMGQVLPVYVACAVVVLAGLGVFQLGRKIGER